MLSVGPNRPTNFLHITKPRPIPCLLDPLLVKSNVPYILNSFGFTLSGIPTPVSATLMVINLD